jgi:hypothetical protein
VGGKDGWFAGPAAQSEFRVKQFWQCDILMLNYRAPPAAWTKLMEVGCVGGAFHPHTWTVDETLLLLHHIDTHVTHIPRCTGCESSTAIRHGSNTRSTNSVNGSYGCVMVTNSAPAAVPPQLRIPPGNLATAVSWLVRNQHLQPWAQAVMLSTHQAPTKHLE